MERSESILPSNVDATLASSPTNDLPMSDNNNDIAPSSATERMLPQPATVLVESNPTSQIYSQVPSLPTSTYLHPETIEAADATKHLGPNPESSEPSSTQAPDALDNRDSRVERIPSMICFEGMW